MTKNEEGFDFAIGVPRLFMRAHGIWPGFCTSKVGLIRYAFMPAAVLILFFINIPQTIQVFESHNLNDILNILTLGDVPIGITLAKLLGVSYKQKVLNEIIVSISEDWKCTTKESELAVMRQNARQSRWFSIIFILLCEGTLLAYSTQTFYLAFFAQSQAEEAGLEDYEKPLYFVGKFPYDTQSRLSYRITWALQIIAAALAAGTFSSVDALFVSLVFHLCGQLTNLQAAFLEIGKGEKDGKGSLFAKQLEELIKKHKRINAYADIIESSFNMMFLVQVMCSTLLLCLQGYLFAIFISTQDFVLVEMIFMLYFTICFTFSIFVYCYVAEMLREKSFELGYSIFYSKWYNLPANEARLLILSMIRCKKPLEITAGKVCIFSLNLFCVTNCISESVLKLSKLKMLWTVCYWKYTLQLFVSFVLVLYIVKTSVGYVSVLLAVRDKIT